MAEQDVVDGEATEITADDTDPDGPAINEARNVPAVIEQAAQTQALEQAQASPPTTVLPSPKEWEAAMTMAATIAKTEFVPKQLRGRPDAVLACILAGREVGLGPMQALRDINVIDGKPSFSASLMMAMMRRGGVRVLASESTPERAWIHAKRTDTGEEAAVEWTMAEAREVVQGGKRLVEKDNWRNFPADMLWARAVGRLARRIGSDLLGGMIYTSEEIADFDDYEGSYSTGTRATPTETPLGKQIVDQRKDAPKTWPEIMERLTHAEPNVDWSTSSTLILHAWYGPQYHAVSDLPEEERPFYGVRLANLAAELSAKMTDGDFPPVTEEECREALAKTFDGLVLDEFPVYPEPTKEELEAEADREAEAAAEAAEAAAAERDPESPSEEAPVTPGSPPEDPATDTPRDPVAEAQAFLNDLPDVPSGGAHE